MQTLTIVTSSIIDSSISSEIINGFPYTKKIVSNTEKELFLGKSPNEIILYFDEYYDSSSKMCIFDDTLLKTIPFLPIYFNTLYFRNINSAKYVLSIIAKKYENILIYDENSDVFTTIEKFLK
jgi:hypothetical protein